jgi:glycosyltransferase involved in cell wall biosynthesis
MKIGIVLSDVPTYSETFLVTKIRSLKELGHDVILFVSNKTRSFDLCKVILSPRIPSSAIRRVFFIGFQVLRLLVSCPTRLFRFVILERKARRTWAMVARNLGISAALLPVKLDWLHFGFGTFSLGRENVAQVIGARLAVSFRGFDHYVYPIKHPGAYSLLLRVADKFHVLSQHMKQDLIRQGVNPTCIEVIPPAIDVSKFRANEYVETTTLRIITVARLHWIKGLEYTLHALRALVDRGLSFHYTIVGEGSEYDRLMFACHQLGLTEYVTFAGKKSHDETASLLRNHHLYIQYSIQEGFCNAVLEAQLAGLLCIVSDADGLTENVVNGETGWIVPRRNPLALASKILEVVGLPEEEHALIRSKAIARVCEQFDVSEQRKAFASFYAAV